MSTLLDRAKRLQKIAKKRLMNIQIIDITDKELLEKVSPNDDESNLIIMVHRYGWK